MTTTTDTRQAVLAAYRQHATENGAWVGFAELRHTTGLDHDTFDAAIHALAEHDEVYLTPEVNQKTLSQDDWDAAVWIGGEWKHLFSIYR